jgi:hypothetical protein
MPYFNYLEEYSGQLFLACYNGRFLIGKLVA